MSDIGWQSVLDFWFLPVGTLGYGQRRSEWFLKDPDFDDAIRDRFGTLVEQALSGQLPTDWQTTPSAILAQIILLDQFTRNIYRDTPQAFAGDARALSLAHIMIAAGADKALVPIQRCFVYLPFEHAEDIGMQQRSIALFTQLHQQTGEHAAELDYAVRHEKIIAQFGRFPHRNIILGRASTTMEQDFLAQPNSGF